MYAANTWISCVDQSDILFSLDFDANGPVEPVDSFSTVGRRKSSTGAVERSCQTPFFSSSSSKIKWYLPDNPHMWNKWPNDLHLFRPTCLMPPTTVLSDTPPTGKQTSIIHVCLLSLLPWKDWPHTSCHTEVCEQGGLLHLLVEFNQKFPSASHPYNFLTCRGVFEPPLTVTISIGLQFLLLCGSESQPSGVKRLT